METQRHPGVACYKQPANFRDWLEQRLALPLEGDRVIHVWVAGTEPLGPQSTGPPCIAYEERFGQLDAQELSRYSLMSGHWRLDHAPCIVNLMALCAIACQLGILVIGHFAKREDLKDRLIAHFNMRHDIVRRNGKTKGGIAVVVLESGIIELISDLVLLSEIVAKGLLISADPQPAVA